MWLGKAQAKNRVQSDCVYSRPHPIPPWKASMYVYLLQDEWTEREMDGACALLFLFLMWCVNVGALYVCKDAHASQREPPQVSLYLLIFCETVYCVPKLTQQG